MLTYGVIFRNMKYMSTYETILSIINPHVDMILAISYLKLSAILKLEINKWNHAAQHEHYVGIWNDKAHYQTICQYIKQYCISYVTKWRYIVDIKSLYVDISINSAGIVFYVNTWFILRNMVAYVDKWPLNLTHHENGAIASHRNIRRLCW